MDDFITVFLIFISGVVTGWFWHARAMLGRLLNDPDRMIKMLQDYKKVKDEVEVESESNLKITEVKVEKIGDQFYLFTKDNDEFLAQGTSLEEALESIKKRYPNRNFKGLISKEQAEKMGLSKQH